MRCEGCGTLALESTGTCDACGARLVAPFAGRHSATVDGAGDFTVRPRHTRRWIVLGICAGMIAILAIAIGRAELNERRARAKVMAALQSPPAIWSDTTSPAGVADLTDAAWSRFESGSGLYSVELPGDPVEDSGPFEVVTTSEQHVLFSGTGFWGYPAQGLMFAEVAVSGDPTTLDRDRAMRDVIGETLTTFGAEQVESIAITTPYGSGIRYSLEIDDPYHYRVSGWITIDGDRALRITASGPRSATAHNLDALDRIVASLQKS